MPTDVTIRVPVYQHLPTRVEAMQLTAATWREVLAWMAEAGAYYWAAGDDTEVALWLAAAAPGQDSKIRIRTPQGARRVLMDDWVVHGVEGIWYPVHDAVWQASYELWADGD